MKHEHSLVYRHSKISAKIKELIPLCKNVYCIQELNSMLEKSEKIVTNFDWENRTLSNPSEREIRDVFMSLLRMVKNKHSIKTDWCSILHLPSELEERVLQTKIPRHIIESRVLLKRRVGKILDCDPMEKELNEMLLSEMYKCFVDQNEKLIIKYSKYETSK